MKARLSKYNLVACLVCSFIVLLEGAFFPSIQWTPHNPLIKNMKDKVRKVRNDDGLNIWCPKEYTQLEKTVSQVHPSNMYFTLYKVETKQEYDDCDATNGKTLLVCNDPEGKSVKDEENYLLYFRETPLYKNMDPYPPGKTFYFIGTSGGKDKTLHNKIGGKCASHQLKFAIYICRDDEKDCNVDVLDGGWTMWHKKEETGLCERNCTNPEPQNGGKPCSGPRTISCSEVIISQKKEEPNKVTTMELTTQATAKPTTLLERTTETPSTNSIPLPTKAPTTKVPTTRVPGTTADSNTSTESTEGNKAFDGNQKEQSGDDEVTLSMKGAVLTFIGLFVLGCIVGIVQVFAILHIRSKRKQSEPIAPPPSPV